MAASEVSVIGPIANVMRFRVSNGDADTVVGLSGWDIISSGGSAGLACFPDVFRRVEHNDSSRTYHYEPVATVFALAVMIDAARYAVDSVLTHIIHESGYWAGVSLPIGVEQSGNFLTVLDAEQKLRDAIAFARTA
jgi:hypothetical protein